jgi:hypothetical protein
VRSERHAELDSRRAPASSARGTTSKRPGLSVLGACVGRANASRVSSVRKRLAVRRSMHPSNCSRRDALSRAVARIGAMLRAPAPPRRPGWQVARLVRDSRAPTARALLHCSRDACGSVVATARPVLAGPGSGTSSGGFARSLGGEEGDQRASPRVAEGRRPLLVCGAAALAPASLSWPLSRLQASHGRSPRTGLPRPHESCARSIASSNSILRSITRAVSVLIMRRRGLCAHVRACGAAIMRRRKLRGRRHRRMQK